MNEREDDTIGSSFRSNEQIYFGTQKKTKKKNENNDNDEKTTRTH